MREKFNIAESGSLFISALFAMSVISVLLGFFSTSIYWGGLSLLNWLAYALNPLAIIVTLVIFAKIRRVNFLTASGLKSKVNYKQMLLTPFITVASLVAFLPLATMFADLLFLAGYSGGVAVPTSAELGPYFLSIFVIAAMPAIAEELLMRGAVLKGLNDKGVFFGVFISAFLFSFMHQNPLQTVYQFCFGAVLATMAVHSNSTAPTILTHFFNNFISLTISSFAPTFLSFGYGNYNYLIYFAMFIGGMIVLVLLLLLFYKAKHKKTTDTVVYEDITFFVPVEKTSFIKEYFLALGGIFTKSGWKRYQTSLENSIGYTPAALPKGAAVSVYIAIGFVTLWWVVALIYGFI